MGLTIFSIPKAFVGHSGIIQRNALDSWAMQSDVEIVLLGDDEGVAQAAEEVGAVHIPDLERTEHGTPRLDRAFTLAQDRSPHELLCYVNADIILPQDFAANVRRVPFPRVLMVGSRWDRDVEERLDLSRTETWTTLKAGSGDVGPPFAIDYFVYSRQIDWQMPPFAVGRTLWDNWLIFRVRELGLPVVDMTPAVFAVHQSHDYSHIAASKSDVWKGEEAQRNRSLADLDRLFTIEDATHVLARDGLRPARDFRYRRQRWLNRPLLARWSRPVVRDFVHSKRPSTPTI